MNDCKGGLWRADYLGTNVEWFREAKKPNRIHYAVIRTSDGQMHYLKNVKIK